MRYEWKPPEALWSGQRLCYVEGPLEDLALTRHEASERQLAHEILRLAARVRELEVFTAEQGRMIANLKETATATAVAAHGQHVAALEEENRRLRDSIEAAIDLLQIRDEVAGVVAILRRALPSAE